MSQPLLTHSHDSVGNEDVRESIYPDNTVNQGDWILESLSQCPGVAFSPETQSVDLLGQSDNLFDIGQNGCTYFFTKSGPPFDWISVLHNMAIKSFPVQQPRQKSSHHRHMEFIMTNLRLGIPPIGAPATLQTLYGFNELAFTGVKEINAAFSRAWIHIYICFTISLCIPIIGICVILAIILSHRCRQYCDEWAMHYMQRTCDRLNVSLQNYGIAFLLLGGTFPEAYIDNLHNNLGPGGFMISPPYIADENQISEASGLRKVWILRVFMAPGYISNNIRAKNYQINISQDGYIPLNNSNETMEQIDGEKLYIDDKADIVKKDNKRQNINATFKSLFTEFSLQRSLLANRIISV